MTPREVSCISNWWNIATYSMTKLVNQGQNVKIQNIYEVNRHMYVSFSMKEACVFLIGAVSSKPVKNNGRGILVYRILCNGKLR